MLYVYGRYDGLIGVLVMTLISWSDQRSLGPSSNPFKALLVALNGRQADNLFIQPKLHGTYIYLGLILELGFFMQFHTGGDQSHLQSNSSEVVK